MGDAEPVAILHVEDDREFADLCSVMLRRQSDAFCVRTAYGPREGLETLAAEAIDCVVSDHDMPGMNGIEFLDAARADGFDGPFLLFTGKGSEEVASTAISAGVTDYLQKNGHSETYAILANRIENAVNSYRREQDAERYYRQLEAITEHSADTILTVDAEGRIRYVNRAVEGQFGYPPEALLGEPLTTLMPERFHDRHLEGFDRYLRTGERSVDWANVEFRGLRKDGTEIPLSISYGEYSQDGEHRFIGILREQSA